MALKDVKVFVDDSKAFFRNYHWPASSASVRQNRMKSRVSNNQWHLF
jgi:hypothetical protein